MSDAPVVQKLAGDKAIADTTLNIPFPYTDGIAEQWIGGHKDNFEKGVIMTLAVTIKPDDELTGAISLIINKRFERAEMGYWIGLPYWNKGYCTEAAGAMLNYGFEMLALNKIDAHYFTRNPSSGRVMEKIGMKFDGCLRQHVRRWDTYEDMNICSILRSEFKSGK